MDWGGSGAETPAEHAAKLQDLGSDRRRRKQIVMVVTLGVLILLLPVAVILSSL